jgi:hypothetical protein
MPSLPVSLKGSQFSVSSVAAPTPAVGLSIAALANGEIAVAWQDGSTSAVQLFSSNGVNVTGEINPALVGGAETLTNERVAALAKRKFCRDLER